MEVASTARFFLPLHLHLLLLPQLKDVFFSCNCPLFLCPASLIFTSLLSTRVFLSEYKHAIIFSIFKKSPLTPTPLFSYCSISLLSLIVKVTVFTSSPPIVPQTHSSPRLAIAKFGGQCRLLLTSACQQYLSPLITVFLETPSSPGSCSLWLFNSHPCWF